MEQILKLCGLIVYNLGDLDMMPFASDIIELLSNEKLEAIKNKGLFL